MLERSALELAASFYRTQLRVSHDAVAYLKVRGLRGDIAAVYGVGYAPAGFQALRKAFPNYDDLTLNQIGLVVNSGGRRYDRFRDRIMFPIADECGCVIGFGGRILGEGKGHGPKYLNSPENPLFKKSRVLFGLNQAAETIAATNTIYVVEGYLDVLSLAQHGIKNAVATLGTATTSMHVERLLGLAKHVIFCFDGDAAGRRAAAHALDLCIPHVAEDVKIKFLVLPNKHDPDSYVMTKGGEAFKCLVSQAMPIEDFFLALALQGCELQYAEGKARLVAKVAPRLQKINAKTMLMRILIELAVLAELSVDELRDLCGLS